MYIYNPNKLFPRKQAVFKIQNIYLFAELLTVYLHIKYLSMYERLNFTSPKKDKHFHENES